MQQVNVFGVPYEGIENFQRGVSLAPAFIRYHLKSLEYYSVLQKRELRDFCDLSDVYVPPLSDLTGKEFSDFLIDRLKALKVYPPFIALGGDHFITLPIIKYLKEVLEFNFKVVHFDAHMDRRPQYEGEEYNHATFMFHVEKLLGEENVITVGVRTKAPCEEEKGNIFYAWDEYREVLKSIDSPIYLTLDLDVINPSEFPGVSNPEPGGKGVLDILEDILHLKKIMAADIVEFSPLVDYSTHSATKAAFLFREILIKLQYGL